MTILAGDLGLPLELLESTKPPHPTDLRGLDNRVAAEAAEASHTYLYPWA